MDILYDFNSLWAAGCAVLDGQNPYEKAEIRLVLMQSLPKLTNIPGGFHNPFWTVPIFVLLGLLPYPLACMVWSIGSVEQPFGQLIVCCPWQ